MLIQFKVKNFMSFRDETVLSMKPGKGAEHEENIIYEEGFEALRSAAIYGANASGKTNVIKAFTAMIMMVRGSNEMQKDQPLGWIVPFSLDKRSLEEPSSFEIVFIAKGTKYIYGFSAQIDRIIDEYLYAYYTQKPTTIFERENTNEYFFPNDKKELEDIRTKNISNKLFLSTATNWNYKETEEPFDWLNKCIDTYDITTWINPNFELLVNDDALETKKFVKNMLKIADISIDDYDVKETEIPKEQLKQMVPAPVYSEMIKNVKLGQPIKSYNLFTTHKVSGKNGDERYMLDFMQESLGTQRLFNMAPHFKQAFDNGKTMVIDEIEGSLHPLFVEAIIDMFNDPKINKNDAQLIFTTHDINVLTLDIFRRDQIFFTEKKDEEGASCLFSLDEINIRKDEKVGKRYIQGRYGAIPMIDRSVDLWD